MELQSLFKLHYQPSFLPRLSLVSTSLTPLSKTTFFTPKKKFPHLHKPFSPNQSSPSPSCRPPRPLSVSAASVALQTDKGRLPADIEVIETKEPHSRVSIFYPSFTFCFSNWIRMHHLRLLKEVKNKENGHWVFLLSCFYYQKFLWLNWVFLSFCR